MKFASNHLLTRLFKRFMDIPVLTRQSPQDESVQTNIFRFHASQNKIKKARTAREQLLLIRYWKPLEFNFPIEKFDEPDDSACGRPAFRL